MVGRATLTTTSAPQASSAEPTDPPASEYSLSGCPALSPAPDSTATSSSPSANEPTTSGISATRRSPSRDSLGTPPLMRAARAYSKLRRILPAAEEGADDVLWGDRHLVP